MAGEGEGGVNWEIRFDINTPPCAKWIAIGRRQWHSTPVLLPGKSHGWRSLVGCSSWVVKSRTGLSDFTFTFHFRALEKDLATHSSALAWRIPGTGEPGGLPSMGSHRVGHDWSDLAAAAGTCSIAQGAQLGALWWPSGVGWGIGREVHEGRDICLHVADIHFVVQQKLTQHCKAIILQ